MKAKAQEKMETLQGKVQEVKGQIGAHEQEKWLGQVTTGDGKDALAPFLPLKEWEMVFEGKKQDNDKDKKKSGSGSNKLADAALDKVGEKLHINIMKMMCEASARLLCLVEAKCLACAPPQPQLALLANAMSAMPLSYRFLAKDSDKCKYFRSVSVDKMLVAGMPLVEEANASKGDEVRSALQTAENVAQQANAAVTDAKQVAAEKLEEVGVDEEVATSVAVAATAAIDDPDATIDAVHAQISALLQGQLQTVTDEVQSSPMFAQGGDVDERIVQLGNLLKAQVEGRIKQLVDQVKAKIRGVLVKIKRARDVMDKLKQLAEGAAHQAQALETIMSTNPELKQVKQDLLLEFEQGYESLSGTVKSYCDGLVTALKAMMANPDEEEVV
eukprot:NODE_330_length_1884_cov_83.947139_g237_i0.p1 GENE.NODE_330_length_1884_cov_83.947139_g237_i0~~NODE_330_length_1884_cov_83.947139_g237_i0.p1  ORF type:complete len:386 (+),score=145.76 NODE_330_length_1884_cov_83.947139_g237_i0:93-1250(+)